VLSRNNVRGINRGVALFIALVWLCSGVAVIVFGYTSGRWLLFALGLVAFWYALLWVRVVLRSRLLTWREFAAPWREQ